MVVKNLPIGTKVVINDNSEYFWQGTNENGKMVGEIIENRYSERYTYYVKWNDKSENCYKLKDLDLYEQINDIVLW